MPTCIDRAVPPRIEKTKLWNSLSRRYAAGEYRAKVCAKLVRAEIARDEKPRILDIGCGRGFFDDAAIQRSLASRASEYVGIEPDDAVQPGRWVDRIYREPFEQAPIRPASVDLGVSAMVIEHLETPQNFFSKLFDTLRPGGVFWGFTIDARHWFARASLAAHRLGLAGTYLETIHGRRGRERYDNYNVHYSANTPADLRKLTNGFASCHVLNLSQPGQIDFYFPQRLRWVGRSLDRIGAATGMPGPLLAVRLVR